MIKSEFDEVDLRPPFEALQSKAVERSTPPPPSRLNANGKTEASKSVIPDVDKSERSVQREEKRLRSPSPPPTLSAGSAEKLAQDRDTETESETDGPQVSKATRSTRPVENANPKKSAIDVDVAETEKTSQEPGIESQKSSAPAKKRKTPESDSDSDSDAGRGSRSGRAKPAPRGVRQPLRRGGKKF